MSRANTNIVGTSSAKRTGDISEMLACSWLLAKGYDVFRNVCSVGPVDIVALDREGTVRLYDVKTQRDTNTTLHPTVLQKRLGVRLIGVNPDSWTCHEP